MAIWPNIDPRVHAVGTTKMREMNAEFLRTLADHLYLIQDGDTPLAVVVGYDAFIALQNRAESGGR